MKIAFVSDNFYPELSGITESLLLITQTLAERGHEIFFVVPWYSKKNYALSGGRAAEAAREITQARVARLPSIPLFGSPTKQSRIVLPLGMGIWKLWRAKPDIIHTHTPFGTGIEALIAAKLFSIPLVGTNHTVTQEFARYSYFPEKWVEKILLRYITWYFNKCSFVSSPSQILVNEMKAYGLATPAKQISNPFDLGLFSVPSEEEKNIAKEKFGLSKHTILYTGRLAPEKHVDDILYAIQKVIPIIPDICFAIAGDGKDFAYLKKLSVILDIEKHVMFLGFLPQKDMPLLYKGSEIFVIMSTSETQSLSLIQGMATGIPVLAANARALPEYVSSERGLLIPPSDSEALSRSIIILLKDQPLRAVLGENGRAYTEQFNKEHIATIWEELYKKVSTTFLH